MSTRIYLLGAGLCCATTLFAGSMGHVLPPYDGFYVGGAIGAANLIDKESTSYQPGLYDKHQFSSTGLIGGGLVGYDYSVTDRIKLGIEGFINGTELNLAAEQHYAPFPSYNANMRYNAGVRVLPGYELSPGTVGHVVLGYSYASFHIKDNGNYGFINQGWSGTGFQAGLGIQVPFFCDNLFLRGDALYTTYESKTSLGLSTSYAPQNYYNAFATIEGTLSLIYKFL